MSLLMVGSVDPSVDVSSSFLVVGRVVGVVVTVVVVGRVVWAVVTVVVVGFGVVVEVAVVRVVAVAVVSVFVDDGLFGDASSTVIIFHFIPSGNILIIEEQTI